MALLLALAPACEGGLDGDCEEVVVDGGLPDGGDAVRLVCPEGEPDGGLSVDCEYFCSVEDECGLRTFDECADACPGGDRIGGESDTCIEVAFGCDEIAACPCAERCAREEECFGSPDPECEADCLTLVEQAPEAAYQENRCILESECADLALCTG